MTSLSERFWQRVSGSFLAAIGGERVASPLSVLGDKRFLFITGKGGVGKTTVTAALATALARDGKRVLVVMRNTKERLSAILGTPPIGHDIQKLADGVWAVNAEPERALIEYAALVIKVRALVSTVFQNEYIKAFLRAVPGLFEWAMLGKAWFHTTETDAKGRPVYDVVLFDAPATGHGLDMLRVPKVILDVAPPGVLRRDAERAVSMLRDPKQSGVVVVTLPEEMPVTETLELCAAVETELAMPVLQVVVNAVLAPLFDDAERMVPDAPAQPRRVEPAAYGATVSFGPNTWNFRDIVAALLAAEAAVVVQDGDDLQTFVRRCLTDARYAAELGARAQALVRANLGATVRTVDALMPLLQKADDAPARRVA